MRHLEGKWTDGVLREEEEENHSSCHLPRAVCEAGKIPSYPVGRFGRVESKIPVDDLSSRLGSHPHEVLTAARDMDEPLE